MASLMVGKAVETGGDRAVEMSGAREAPYSDADHLERSL